MLTGAGAQPAGAQPARLAQQCGEAFPQLNPCHRGAQAAAILHGALPLAFAAGNPVQGTASTMGIRLGSTPRLSLGARLSGTRLTAPDVVGSDPGARSAFLSALALEGVVGVTSGFSPLPTVGGVGSLDALFGAGIVATPSEFSASPLAWSAGVRLGILRESFTMPGLSVTGTWRRVGQTTWGDPEMLETDGYVTVSAMGPSLRATIGRRFFGVGLTAGAGHDRWRGDVEWRAPSSVARRVPAYVSKRSLIFGNASWTFLVLHGVVEGGWQSGPELIPGVTRAEVGGRDPARGSFFGSATLRLSI